MAKAKKQDDDFDTGVQFDEESGDAVIDLSDVPDSSFELLPKGQYEVEVEEVEYQISKNSGKPMWNVRFNVAEGDYAGRKLFTFVSFSEKALPMAKQAIAAFGRQDLLEGKFNPREVAEDGSLIGCTARVRVDVDTYEGEKRNRVKGIRKSTGGGGSSEFALD